jgi:hypothetical protein
MIKEAVDALFMFMMGFSSWIYILYCYTNGESAPEVVWGVAIFVAGKYGVTLAMPVITRFYKTYQRGKMP